MRQIVSLMYVNITVDRSVHEILFDEYLYKFGVIRFCVIRQGVKSNFEEDNEYKVAWLQHKIKGVHNRWFDNNIDHYAQS